MKLKLIIYLVIFSFLLLVSCNSQYIGVQTPTLGLKPTINNSPQSRATKNSTVTPSATLSPAQETKGAVVVTVGALEVTQLAYMFTSVPGTLAARNVNCKDGFVLELPLDILPDSNDQWTLFTCSPIARNAADQWTPGVVDFGTRYTQLTKNDLSQTWIIQHKTFDYSIINRPDALLVPYRWTTDGKYLFLFPESYPGASGFPLSAFLYTNINSLYRINLETGYFELVLRSDQFDALALSPDDRLLAYSERDKPNIIHIRNMASGDDLRVELHENIIASGAFIWNSDSTQVVFTVGYHKKSEDWQDDLSSTSIFVLTLQNKHVEKVLAKDPRIFVPYDCSDDHTVWLDKNTICLYSVNSELDSWNKFFAFNIKTGTVTFLRHFP